MEKTDSLYKRITGSASFKLAVIGIFTLLLLIPAGMIKNLIREREQRRDETITEVTSKWGNAQTLCGPVITIPYKTYLQTKEGIITEMHHAHFLPSSLQVTGTITPEIRYRGIYQVIAYNARLSFKGTFDPLNLQALNLKSQDIVWEEAIAEIGIPDLRGINQPISISWNNNKLPVMPGIPVKDISSSGVYSRVMVNDNSSSAFSFAIDINGSHSLNFIPLGKETTVQISSSWNSPSFSGAFLPDERHITDSGFTARWNILQLNRNYPQQWTDSSFNTLKSAFGADLIQQADTYQKSMRSAKYAILFIALTFLILFFAEVINKNRVHPVQYLLVGIALTVFYTLLTALSEHMYFSLSYLLSSVTIITLISVFTQSLYKSIKVSLIVAGSLVLLYVFLYIVLQLTDYALLFGSIGLVVVLALVMYFSRKIDWYANVKGNSGEE